MLVAVFVLILMMTWILGRRGKLGSSHNITSTKGTEGLAPHQSNTQDPVETGESRALLNKLRDAVIQLEPQRLSHLEFHEAYDTRIDNKKVVYLCLRDPATGKFYSWNDLIYVTLHEMAHAISQGYDPQHTSVEFQSNFWQLLRKAERAGIYKPSESFVNEYCAMPIDKNDPGIIIR
jgi:hypothetical protein